MVVNLSVCNIVLIQFLDDEHEDLIRWLNNTKTVNLVSENWDHTTAKRLSMLKGSMEIHNYMDAFPAIKCFDGYRLVNDYNLFRTSSSIGFARVMFRFGIFFGIKSSLLIQVMESNILNLQFSSTYSFPKIKTDIKAYHSHLMRPLFVKNKFVC